jgi:lysophospholipase L1-like esterase
MPDGASLVRHCLLLLVLPAILLVASPVRSAGPARFEWQDGDRVVLIGDALIERDQEYGYLEALITFSNPDKTITFRNLGWSGDTVGGIARAGFGKPEEGYRHLLEHVRALEPTVLIVGYGMTDSFDGAAGLPRFKKGLRQLLDDLAGTRARLVLLAPIEHENLGPPLPDPARHNHDLKLYRDAIEELARERGAWFVDLADKLAKPVSATEPSRSIALTEDGIHLSERGYQRLAGVLAPEFGAQGQAPSDAAGYRRLERLRAAVIAKNRLYFYRWRPQNETYLFGFRKHEQGKNAREIPRFDPLVAEKEQEIARLKGKGAE